MPTAAPEYMVGQRLSPLPEDRANTIRCDEAPKPSRIKSWEEENRRFLRRASENRSVYLIHFIVCALLMAYIIYVRSVIIPNFSLAEHQRLTDEAPLRSGPSRRGGIVIEVPGDKPSIICDKSGVIGAIVIPCFLQKNSLVNTRSFFRCNAHSFDCQSHINEITTSFMAYELALGMKPGAKVPTGASSNGKSRGGANTYTTSHGIFGTATYALAWHQQKHEVCIFCRSTAFRSITYMLLSALIVSSPPGI